MAYQQNMNEMNADWRMRPAYNPHSNPYGIRSPAGYSSLPVTTQPVFTAEQVQAAGAGLQTPVSLMYQQGSLNLFTASPQSAQCDSGCISTHPNPLNPETKGLPSVGYTSFYMKDVMPTAYNTTGMY